MDNRNTQNSLASDVPSEWEKFQQNQKKNLQKKYQWWSIALVGVIVIAVIVFVLSSYRCQIFGHKWIDATCTSPKTCSHCDETEGNPVGHNWAAATCDEPKTCKLCSKKEGTAIGHTWTNANCTTPKTCATCGATEGNALGHSWSEATYTAPKTCSVCGLTEGTVKSRVVDIAAGNGHTLVLKSDGTVQALGHNEYGECNVSGWANIVDICAGSNHSVGVKSNGTVVAVGLNNYGQCNVTDWKDIVYIAAGEFHTVGVRSDGTVVAAGSNHNGGCDVSNWRNVVAVGVTQTGTIGLTADGKILTTKYEDLNWSGIKAISVGDSLAIGLKNNGSVVIGEPWHRNSNLYADTYSKFQNIISVEAGMDCVFGLTSDGHVITSPGTDYNGVSGWTDICMISASDFHIVGLKKDGTLVATGSNNWGECDVDKIN